jgi:SanA protein
MFSFRLTSIIPKRLKALSRRQKWLCVIYGLPTVLLVLVILANWEINANARGKLFSTSDTCPAVDVALIPGTSKYRNNGKENLFFKYRIAAAVQLYMTGKIRSIIVSGDNSSAAYNEPLLMKEDLVAKGIPAKNIYLDYAGFDTWDSMERALRIFGQHKVIVISQQFHNERAIYIGESLGMTVYGFNAKDVESYGGFKTLLREKFARLKVFWNLFWGHSSNTSGEKVLIHPSVNDN